MKKSINIFARVLMPLFLYAGCLSSCYDDRYLLEQLGAHESMLTELERLTSQHNTNLESLKVIVAALQEKDYVTSVSPVKSGEDIAGYTITFSKSGAITIHNGKDSYAPVMGVRQDETDGQWYWTLGGEWMTDSSGARVRASAKDGESGQTGASGVTPQLKIVDGNWYVSYDNGKTWEKESLGQATGEDGCTMFTEVSYDDDYLYITMSDGHRLSLPRSPKEQDNVGILTWSISDVTEVSATFIGRLDVASSNLPFTQVTVYYSDADVFNMNDAIKVSTSKFDANHNFTIDISGLKPNVKYNYCLKAEVKSENIYGDVKSFVTDSLIAPTLNEVTEITERSVTISGKVSIIQSESNDLEYGVEYGKNEDLSRSGVHVITRMDAEGGFSFGLSSLNIGQTYFYRSFVKVNGVVIYGEVKSFVTLSLVPPALNDVSEITYCDAVISGKVNIPKSVRATYGFRYSTSRDFTGRVLDERVKQLDSENNFSVRISSLVPGNTYYYQSYIQYDGEAVYGDVSSFRTDTMDLSSSGSANCYVVSGTGLYRFVTVKGNSSESVGVVTSSEVLWEASETSSLLSSGDLINSVSYKDGYITFQTNDTYKEGNAVIAAKDAAGTILWSWHIWFTDQPQGQVYYNDAGTVMDRNLGATSAMTWDVGAQGLLYQWGRKDPFLCSGINSTNIWPSVVLSDSSKGTIDYATANPTTFITQNDKNYDWYYTGDNSIDNTRWTTSDMTKSIYDPCPSGWRVPDGGGNGVWAKALGSSLSFTDGSLSYESVGGGINFYDRFGSDYSIWYPASGYRDGNDSGLSNVNRGGYYWAASPDGDKVFRMRFYKDGSVYPSNNYTPAYAFSVRCVKE